MTINWNIVASGVLAALIGYVLIKSITKEFANPDGSTTTKFVGFNGDAWSI
jgi:phosphotransferase system  glucose/maltose/N-acetylglucosamine-specific IIC component